MYKRIVIKIGSNVISKEGHLDASTVEMLVEKVAEARTGGSEVVIVTSGAVATGKEIVNASKTKDSMSERQMFAAVGQVGLMALYAKLFREKGFTCAQVLVTKNDFRDRMHYANMKNCFENLLENNIIPIVNNNDTVTLQELGFSDNDEVASLVASQLNADAVLLLSTVEGMLDTNGSVISEVRPESLRVVSGYIKKEKSSAGSGGMENKFNQAVKLMKQGITVYIANGRNARTIPGILSNEAIGTKFVAQKKLSSVKRRLSHAEGLAKGVVYVNQGAEDILLSKGFHSLLPVGVVKIEGKFKKGDTIEIRGEKGKKIGSGVAQYGSDEAASLVGKKGGKALVHYDYLFIE
ncbi:glutamate 5-kinase [Patescibacteria group bacterium]|nr:glutamate 5-kinase [Patescibacteria group bacterium]